jgi:hypothetical protein
MDKYKIGKVLQKSAQASNYFDGRIELLRVS